jgi:hypothetical protein
VTLFPPARIARSCSRAQAATAGGALVHGPIYGAALDTWNVDAGGDGALVRSGRCDVHAGACAHTAAVEAVQQEVATVRR